MLDNVDSVKRLYEEFLIKRWCWNNIEVWDDPGNIVVRTWLEQGSHYACGNPIILWKHNNYPEGYNHELDSLYGKIKQWFLIHWNNK